MSEDRHRVPATVDGSFRYDDKRGETVWLPLKMGGWHQSFGGYHLPDGMREAWVNELRDLFGGEPEGRNCFALYAFGELNEPICGIEVEGRRFIVTDFFRRHGVEVKNKLREARERTIREVSWLTRRINEETARFSTMDESYVEWDEHEKGRKP